MPARNTPAPAPTPAMSADQILQAAVISLPTWASATVVYRDSVGRIVGYGRIEREPRGNGLRLWLGETPEGMTGRCPVQWNNAVPDDDTAAD